MRPSIATGGYNTPLKDGKSQRAISANIKELQKSGSSRKEAVSRAMDHAKVDREFNDKNVRAHQEGKK